MLVLFAITIGALIIGVNKFDWYIEEIAGLFIGMGVLSALIGGIPADTAAKAFAGGARDMAGAAVLIGLSRSVLIVMQEGQVIDTVLHGLSGAIGGLPSAVSAQLMFFVQFAINFFVPSGSGQAALTMPVMTPLADLLHIPRQSAVIAFQLGDGLCNFVIPTSGVTMGILEIAGIPFNLWLKWIWKLMIWLVLAGMVFLAISVSVY